jgi:uncharacterized protein YjbJ (UPF0337 family)
MFRSRNLANCNHIGGKIFVRREYRHLQLTIGARPTGAKIDPGKTPLPSHSGRIAPLSSARARTTRQRPLASFVHPQSGRQPMNWDQIEVNWMLFKDKVRSNWAKLTDEDLTRIGGRRKELSGRLQARYGFAKAEAEREIEAWIKSQRNAA